MENGRTTRCVGKHRQMIRTPFRARGKIHWGSNGRNTSKVETGVKWDERRRKERGEESCPGPRENMGACRRTAMGNRTAVTAWGRMEVGVPYTAVT